MMVVHNALLAYYQSCGRFPGRPYSTDQNGRPMHSWRAHLMPFWPDHDYHITRQYKFNEPWDSPTNERFWTTYGDYSCPGYVESSNITNYVAVVGGSLWSKKGGLPPASGRSLLIVELVESDIVWAKPVDMTLAELASWLRDDPSGGAEFRRRVRHILAVDATGAPSILDPARDIDEIRAIIEAEERRRGRAGQARKDGQRSRASSATAGDPSRNLRSSTIINGRSRQSHNEPLACWAGVLPLVGWQLGI